MLTPLGAVQACPSPCCQAQGNPRAAPRSTSLVPHSIQDQCFPQVPSRETLKAVLPDSWNIGASHPRCGPGRLGHRAKYPELEVPPALPGGQNSQLCGRPLPWAQARASCLSLAAGGAQEVSSPSFPGNRDGGGHQAPGNPSSEWRARPSAGTQGLPTDTASQLAPLNPLSPPAPAPPLHCHPLSLPPTPTTGVRLPPLWPAPSRETPTVCWGSTRSIGLSLGVGGSGHGLPRPLGACVGAGRGRQHN